MPYVTESKKADQVTVAWGLNKSRTTVASQGSQKQQLGFRSRPPSKEEVDSIAAQKRTRSMGTSKRTLVQLDTLGAYFHGTDSGAWSEHDRRYTEVDYGSPSVTTVDTLTGPYTVALTTWGVYQGVFPAAAKQSEILRLGDSLRRATVPDAPSFNLVRAIGELRDAPKMLAMANYRPSSASDVGSAYLNQVFGIQPTLSDMQKGAEAALALMPALSEYTKQERRIIRRRKSYMLQDVTKSYQWSSAGGAPSHIQTGPARFSLFGTLTGNRFEAVIDAHHTERVTAYARYEQVIVRNGSTDYQNSFRRKAERLLGSGLSVSTVYDLTPYTWLFNWYRDLGGVLRYQENLNNSGTFARGGGVSHFVDTTVSCLLRSVKASISEHYPCTLAAVAKARQHVRNSGTSPYSLTPGSPAQLSGDQWAILGAMGLARSAGVPLGWGTP